MKLVETDNGPELSWNLNTETPIFQLLNVNPDS